MSPNRGRVIRFLGTELYRIVFGRFYVFMLPSRRAHNLARLEHLASLGLDLNGKSVLEVGAGIGLLTSFFEDRNCTVVSTDGNASNVRENKRRHPKRDVRLVNLESEETLDLSGLGEFDIIFCYGVLHHLSKPEEALKALAAVCREMILVETCIAPGSFPELLLLRDEEANNQATSGIGCRPTRSWVMETLKRQFGFAYITRTQPNQPEFATDWRILPEQLIYRSVFVGSKRRLVNEDLLTEIPEHQPAYSSLTPAPAGRP